MSPSSSSDRPSGWHLVSTVGLALALMALAALWSQPVLADGVRLVIRATARTSALLFCAAFAAAALYRRWPNGLTRWMRQHRRHLGLSFALSHGMHAAAIWMLYRTDPALFATVVNAVSLIFGGLAYVFILAMAASSSDRMMAWMGPVAWHRLHWLGGWYFWIVFTKSFAGRVPHAPVYLLGVALMLSVLVLRLLAWRQARIAAQGQVLPGA